MKKFALIGNPISHSQSPKLFKEAFPQSDMSYDLVERQTVEESIAYLKEKGYRGANVTSPFKESVMQFVTDPDPITQTLNATNLILFKGKKIFSYNTDYLAVRRIIREHNSSQAIVIGCGGAAKAAALACKDEGLDTFITNRTPKKAKAFATHINIKAVSFAEANTMLNNPAQNILAIYAIPKPDGVLSETLKKAPKDGLISVIEANYKDPCLNPETGLKWLKYQAEESFTLFANHE